LQTPEKKSRARGHCSKPQILKSEKEEIALGKERSGRILLVNMEQTDQFAPITQRKLKQAQACLGKTQQGRRNYSKDKAMKH
jgi:hypothetical protein